MNASPCKYEQEVTTALRFGTLSHELYAHVIGCAECSEIMLVAQFLQRDADSMREIPVPDANRVWRRAVSRSRAETAARAIRPIQWAVHASIAVMIASAFWLVLRLPMSLGWLPARLHVLGLHVVSEAWVAVSVVAVASTIVAALLGAVYILRVDRAPVVLAKI
jgi:hypothetical protein